MHKIVHYTVHHREGLGYTGLTFQTLVGFQPGPGAMEAKNRLPSIMPHSTILLPFIRVAICMTVTLIPPLTHLYIPTFKSKKAQQKPWTHAVAEHR